MSKPNRPKATGKKQKVWYWIQDHKTSILTIIGVVFIILSILVIYKGMIVVKNKIMLIGKSTVATITDKEAQEQNIINNAKCPGGVGVLTFELHGEEVITKSTCTRDNMVKNVSYGGF